MAAPPTPAHFPEKHSTPKIKGSFGGKALRRNGCMMPLLLFCYEVYLVHCIKLVIKTNHALCSHH